MHDLQYQIGQCGRACLRLRFCRDLLKKNFQTFDDLQVVEAAELFQYCFLDLEPLLDAHQCLSDMTSGGHVLRDAVHQGLPPRLNRSADLKFLASLCQDVFPVLYMFAVPHVSSSTCCSRHLRRFHSMVEDALLKSMPCIAASLGADAARSTLSSLVQKFPVSPSPPML